jgi:Carbohydrate family 9 binding domain-like
MIMKTHMQKIPRNVLFVALFLLFMGIFSFFRSTIADYAAWLLAMTHEISLSKAKAGSGESRLAMQIVTANKFTASVKKNSRKTARVSKKKLDDRFKKPVTAKLPKTKTPTISLGEDFPDWDDPGLTLFTPLRKYDGTVWRKEKTEIKGSTDGKKLYLICRFYDKNPDAAVTKNTEGKSGQNAWKDDSIEVFLMKNRKSKVYYQYIASVTGKGTVLYSKNNKAPNSGTRAKLPKGFVKPRFRADDFDGGFEIEMAIDLSNIDISKIKSGDSFLMQVVRNYRGQGYKDSVTLHLFPVYIYADKRFGINNHDRRAFQKVVVKKANKRY